VIRKIQRQLAAGNYETFRNKSWSAFRTEYKAQIVANVKPRSKSIASGVCRRGPSFVLVWFSPRRTSAT